jgi:hypothetical protein
MFQAFGGSLKKTIPSQSFAQSSALSRSLNDDLPAPATPWITIGSLNF